MHSVSLASSSVAVPLTEAPVGGRLTWTQPPDTVERSYGATKRALWHQSARLVLYALVATVVPGYTLARIAPERNWLVPSAVVATMVLLLALLQSFSCRRPRRPGELALDDRGIHLPRREHPLRWSWFRGFDVDPHPLDAKHRRLRLLSRHKGHPPCDMGLPDGVAGDEIIAAVAARLPRVFPAIRDRGPVEGWPLMIGLLMAIAYGVLLGPWVHALAPVASAVKPYLGEVAPYAMFLGFLIGPGLIWAPLARACHPRRLTRHYLWIAMMLNILGTIVLIGSWAFHQVAR